MNDVYFRFVVEELRGMFDAMDDGLQMIPWLEKASDFFRISNSTYLKMILSSQIKRRPERARQTKASWTPVTSTRARSSSPISCSVLTS